MMPVATVFIVSSIAALGRLHGAVEVGLSLGVSAILLLLARALAQLRHDGEALLWTLKKERLAFETSSLFIACPPEQVERRLEVMMRLLGEGYSSERVYLLLLDGSRRAFTWMRSGTPVDWPAVLFAHVDEIVALPLEAFRIPHDGVPISNALRATLAMMGVADWSCVKVDDGLSTTALLCFDRKQPTPEAASASYDNLLLLANVVYNALLKQRMYRKRSELEARLRKAARLEAVGTFTTGVAHNFNNLVGAIAGEAEMALDLLPKGHEAAVHIRRLASSSSRAQGVASQILAFGSVGARARRDIATPAILRETISYITPAAAAAGVRLAVEGIERQAQVQADPGTLQQVFHNVILNAVEATDRGGCVSVALDVATIADRPVVGGRLRSGAFVRVTIADRGKGMDASTLGRLFEPFFTTRPTGTGLGLATAFETLRELDGGIEVESSPGQGTTMILWIPEAQAPMPSNARTTSATVMIVNPDAEAVLRDEETLASLGYEPVGFAAFDAAARALSFDAGRFDLIIVEGGAVGGGPDFLRSARASLVSRQRIIISGAKADVDALALEDLDAFAHIGRPWHTAVVASTLNEALTSTAGHA